MRLLFVLMFLFICIDADADSVRLDSERHCLAATIFFEARGEILSAQVAVAQLTRVRVNSGFYENSYCGVVKDYSTNKVGVKICAYEWYCKPNKVMNLTKRAERRAWERALVLADSFLSSTPPVFVGLENATLFHDDSISPWWSKIPTVRLVAIIGNLYFYEETVNGRLVAFL